MRFAKIIIFILCIMGFVFFCRAQNSTPHHMLWAVTSENGEQGYLVGSVAMADADTYPLDEAYQRKFDQAEVIGFAGDIDSLRTQSQLIFTEKGFYDSEDHLKNHLSVKTYQQLNHRLNELGMPLGHNPRMRPWLLAITLQNLEINEAGFAREGIDEYFYEKARENEKETITLSPSEHLSTVLASIPNKKQLKYLEYRLKTSQHNVDRLRQLMSYWKKGKINKIKPLLGRPVKGFSKQLYDRVVYIPHKAWAAEIKTLINLRNSPLFVLDLKHLIGPKGILSLLKKEGLTVKQL